MAVLLGVCNWVHPLLQSPSCCKKLKETGIDAIQLDFGFCGGRFSAVVAGHTAAMERRG